MGHIMEKSISLGFVSEENLARPTERKDAAANRQLLMDTARDLFATAGVAEVTMADIAKEAGVGKGTLYRRFAHKGELCLALLDKQLQTFQDHTLAHLREMTSTHQPYLVQLDYFLDELVQFITANLSLMCEIDRSPMPPEGLVQDVNQPHYWQEMTVRGLLMRAVQAGELSHELDIEYLASALMATLNTSVLRHQIEVNGFTIVRISAGLRQLVRQFSA